MFALGNMYVFLEIRIISKYSINLNTLLPGLHFELICLIFMYLGNRHMDITRKVYESFRMQLLTSLPMDDVIFLGLLREQKLFPTNLKERIQARSTKAQKTELFLDKAIERSLYIDDAQPLHNLLTVMSNENCHNCVHLKELASKIKQELSKETG